MKHFTLLLVSASLCMILSSCSNQQEPQIRELSSKNYTFNHPTQLFGDAQTDIDTIERLNREIPNDPENADLYMQRGMAYGSLVRSLWLSSMSPAPDSDRAPEWEAQARADFDMVIKLEPDNAQAYFERSMLSGTTEQKIDDLTTAINLDPSNSDYYRFRASNYVDSKEYHRAITDYTAAMEFAKEITVKADIQILRAQAYVASEELELALKDYDEGLKMLPNYTQAANERDVIARRVMGKLSISATEAVPIPEAGISLGFPVAYSLTKNSEKNRRGSFVSYDFGNQKATPMFQEVQFFSEESIREFTDKCAAADYPCFFGNYPDLELYHAQQAAFQNREEYPGYELKQFYNRRYFVSQFPCTGDSCVIREYTTFIEDTKVDIWIMMRDVTETNQADTLMEAFEIIEAQINY